MASLAEVGLDDRADRVAANVSHGEQRQLEVAMALAMKPRMFAARRTHGRHGQGRGRGMHGRDTERQLKGDKTILLVEHDMDAVFSLADQPVGAGQRPRHCNRYGRKIFAVIPKFKRAYLGDGHA